MRTLVTGGIRSGKSAHAESLVDRDGVVSYLATSSVAPDDSEWAARIAAHRARRPDHWQTVETTDLAGAFGALEPESTVLVDSLGSWLAARLDHYHAWTDPRGAWQDRFHAEVDAAVAALPPRVVLVSDEVGLGGVPGHQGARLFADTLGEVNQAFAAVCDEVHLVVAGRVLRL